MRLLLLGGTEFVGRATAEAATARGWDVTVFHRGVHTAPPGVRALYGDRTTEAGLEALGDEQWDLVLDTWSGAPSAVARSARRLSSRAGRYVHVSSCSVYAWPPPFGADESAPVVAGDPDADATSYHEDKRGGELAVLREFGAERSLLVRCGLLLGPYENVGRLPYWLTRMARGGDVLAPGPRELPLQYVDVRDLADWMLDASAAGLSGPYNLMGPAGSVTMGELLARCREVTGSDAELHWKGPEFLAGAGVQPWTELPVWVPSGSELEAIHRWDASAAGLRTRPLEETVADTWQWLVSIGGTAPHRPDRTCKGLDAEKERRILGP